MMQDCRECGGAVAARAKTCPHCGVKKPTATKLETGLDSFAAGAFKLGLMLCLLVVVIVACVSLVSCSSTDSDATPSPTTTTTTTDSRPKYCSDYDTWTEADDKMDALEDRHGPDTSTWPAGTLDTLFAAMDRRAAAVERVWSQAPKFATISSVQAACN